MIVLCATFIWESSSPGVVKMLLHSSHMDLESRIWLSEEESTEGWNILHFDISSLFKMSDSFQINLMVCFILYHPTFLAKYLFNVMTELCVVDIFISGQMSL